MKSHSLFNLFAAALVALGVASCDGVEYFDPQQQTEGEVSLTLSEQAITIKAQADEASVQVLSNASWIASSGADWCEVNPPSNRGDSRLLVRYKANPSIMPRTANVLVRVGEQLVRTLVVSQPGASLVTPTLYKAGVPLMWFDIEIKAQGLWSGSVDCEGGWCTLEQTEGEDVTKTRISVASNLTGAARTAMIEIVCGYNRTTLTVEQAGELSKPELTLTDSGDALALAWTAVEGATAYNVLAVDEGRIVASKQVEATQLNYDLDALQDEFFAAYVGPATLQVEAVTADPAITSRSGASSPIHSHFGVASGDGESAAKAYIVSGIRHLRNISRFVGNYRYYAQDADIALPAAEAGKSNFVPIQNFLGSYDGAGHTISGLTIVSTTGNVGFIGLTAPGTEAVPVKVANLNLDNVSVKSTATGAAPAAALIGNTGVWFSLTDCHVTRANVESTGNQIAGLVGNASDNCRIESSSFDGAVSGVNNVGGICANGYPRIWFCRNEGMIIGKAYVGGIAGSMARGSVTYCYNTGVVSATNSGDSPAGGIVGRAQGNSGGVRISCCFNSGEVKTTNSAGSNIGGIIGKIGDETSSMENCYNVGRVTSVAAANEAGGIVGLFSGTAASTDIIVNCYNVGSVSAPKGGSVAGKIANSTAAVSGCHFLLDDGIVGVFNGSTAGVSGHDAAAMSAWSTFVGWDSVIWSIKAGYAYPQLNELPHK